MKIELKSWLIGMLTGGVVLVISLLVFPVIEPNAPETLIRALLLRASIGVTTIMLMAWGIPFIDDATPGDWAKTIGEDPYASASVYIAIIIAVVYGARIL